jgi:hypothetical protein
MSKEEIYYTDEALLRAEHSRLSELEGRANELEAELSAAQERLKVLVAAVRARSAEVDREQVAALVPWARSESVLIVQDARQRAAELAEDPHALEFSELGRLLLSHFELQERLVNLVTGMALEAHVVDA